MWKFSCQRGLQLGEVEANDCQLAVEDPQEPVQSTPGFQYKTTGPAHLICCVGVIKGAFVDAKQGARDQFAAKIK